MTILKQKKFAMTVDVEEYFQVAAFDGVIDHQQWGTMKGRVAESTMKVLDIFSQNDVKATFFVLGIVARKHPELIKEIITRGHELASHGTNHQKADTQDYDVFYKDVKDAKSLLEDIGGREVIGYRAPSFSINNSNKWAFDALLEAGYIYSSSTYPVKHDHYGVPDWPRVPYQLENGLIELPQSTVDMFGRMLPVGGGGYFRLAPYQLSRYFIKKFSSINESSYIFYFHPWEIDPGQPIVKGASLKSQFRHRVNLSRMERKIIQLSKDFEWTTMRDAFISNGVD